MVLTPPRDETVLLRTGPAAALACPVVWNRSARARRLSLRIEPRRGAVVVTLPPRASRREGLALLATHAAWVSDRLSGLERAVPFADGAVVAVGGAPHRVRHDPAARVGAIGAGEIRVPGEVAFLPRRVGDLLRAEARRRILPLVARHGAAAGRPARAVRIKDTRSRWGSCAADGTLAFSWRLVMAPPHVLDYVVAHEVAHLREMNHSARFWAVVEALTPHRAAAVAWLRAHGAGLLRVG